MKKLMCVGVGACSMLLMGCQSINTGIEKNQDGSYTMTRTSQGFLRVYGSVFNCTGKGKSMACEEIASE